MRGAEQEDRGAETLNILRALVCCVFAATTSSQSRPDLVVIISIDQFRPDYLERFDPLFGESGFRRFAKTGAVFPEVHHTHGVTFTGPGHATIGSGRTPSRSEERRVGKECRSR